MFIWPEKNSSLHIFYKLHRQTADEHKHLLNKIYRYNHFINTTSLNLIHYLLTIHVLSTKYAVRAAGSTMYDGLYSTFLSTQTIILQSLLWHIEYVHRRILQHPCTPTCTCVCMCAYAPCLAASRMSSFASSTTETHKHTWHCNDVTYI